MSCTVNSSLRIVEWRKDLTLIPLSNSPGSHYQFNAEKSSLVIAQLLAADKGLYQCIAETASNHRIPSNSVLLDVLGDMGSFLVSIYYNIPLLYCSEAHDLSHGCRRSRGIVREAGLPRSRLHPRLLVERRSRHIP